MNIHSSQFAEHLSCEHCYEEISSVKWPINGDSIPFYNESIPSEYSIKLMCQNCGKYTYVVWDSYPGPIESLDMSDGGAISTNGVNTDSQLYLAVKVMVQQAINNGIGDYEELIRQAEQAYGAQFNMDELRSLFRSAWIELHQ